MGQTVITATHASALPGRAGAARGGDRWTGSSEQVRSELSRFGPQAGMAELVERWTGVVGESIARNAWPARIARDGTVHVEHRRLGLGVRARPAQRPRSRSASACRGCASLPGRCRRPPSRPPSAACAPRRETRNSAAARSPPGSSDRGPARKCAKSGQFGPRQRARRPPDLIHFQRPGETRVLQAFLRMAKTPAKAGLLGQGHHGPRRSRARPSAARHVHRLDRASAASTTSSTRSSTTRSTRPSAGFNDPIDVTIHPDNSVTVVDRGRGIPVDVGRGHGLPALDGRADEAARRRQVRRRRLQGLRRPARRRRSPSSTRSPSGSSPTVERDGKVVPPGVHARRRRRARWRRSARRRRPARRSRSSPDAEIFEETEFYDATTLLSRFREIGVPDTRPADDVHRRARRRRRAGRVPLRGRHQGLRQLRQRDQGHRPPSRRLLRERRPTTARSRSRCSGTPPTRSRCSRSPTTSTRTRAARTCRASARR